MDKSNYPSRRSINFSHPKSNISEFEKVLLDLIAELRLPRSDAEKQLASDIKEIKEKGRIVDIPGEWL